ncbi:MAG: alpha/beta hydrolase, partial [Pseudomonadota bacterium]|nr:alpha/beta hydrolase [Pseudomonadota bacterium]
RDNTALGKGRADPELQARLGDYPVLARAAAARIRGAQLILYPDYGHSPQVQAPDRFHEDLLKALAR